MSKTKMSNKPLNKPQSIKKEFKPTLEIPWWGAYIIFFITTFVFFGGQLFGDWYFWEDIVRYVYPVQTFAANQGGLFDVPFWNSYSFAGMPFFADLQVGFFYPFNRVMALFVNSDGMLPIGVFQFFIIMHYIIAQIAMYHLARFWKISSLGAILSAISYGFSMLLVCHLIHPMIVYHLVWLPLIIKFYIRAIRDLRIKCAVAAGVMFGLSLLAGHPQTALYEGLMLAVIFFWYFIGGIRDKSLVGGKIGLSIAGALLPAIIGAGIFAVQLLPSQELAKHSQRETISYEKSVEGSLDYASLFTAVVPHAYGEMNGQGTPEVQYYKKNGESVQGHFYWETAFYFGIAAMVLGIFGAIIGFKTKEGALLVFLSLFGLLYALGDNGFLYQIFYNFPMFGNFRNPARIMFFTSLGMSVLMGFGFDYLWKYPKSKDVLIKLLISAALPLILALLVLSNVTNATAEAEPIISGYATTAIIFIALILLTAIVVNRRLLRPEAGFLVLAIVSFIDLYMASSDFNKSSQNPQEMFSADAQMLSALQPKIPDDIFRVNMRIYEPVSGRLMKEDNQGMVSGIMLVEGYNPLILKRVKPPVKTRQEILDFYNVKYFTDVDRQRQALGFFESQTYFPRAWMVHKAVTMTPEETETQLEDKGYNYKELVVIEEKSPIDLPATPDSAYNDIVECVEYQNDNFKYKVKTKDNGFLSFSEIWYPDWKAYVDGEEVPMLRANYCFRAVPVPAGEHIVEMRYESAAFSTGLTVSLAVFILSVLGFVYLEFFRKEKPTEAE